MMLALLTTHGDVPASKSGLFSSCTAGQALTPPVAAPPIAAPPLPGRPPVAGGVPPVPGAPAAGVVPPVPGAGVVPPVVEVVPPLPLGFAPPVPSSPAEPASPAIWTVTSGTVQATPSEASRVKATEPFTIEDFTMHLPMQHPLRFVRPRVEH